MRIKKRKSILFLLILCFVLTSCKKETTPTEKQGGEVVKKEPTTAATATPTPTVTETPTVTVSTTGDNQGLDYSDHTNSVENENLKPIG
jgi:PBP1b-binding outer membrane lipoprotein LpoB